MAQLCLVMQGTWDDIPKARIAHLSPFMPRRCRVMDEAHGLSQPLLTLLHLTGCCTEQNATVNFYLAKDDSRQIADLTHAKQFLWVVFTIVKFPVETDVRFFSITLSKLFCMKIHHCGFKQHPLLRVRETMQILLSWLLVALPRKRRNYADNHFI